MKAMAQNGMTIGDVLRLERARYERAVDHLTRIYSLLNPPKIEVQGKTFEFKNPDASATLQALSDAIRQIPEEMRSARSAEEPMTPAVRRGLIRWRANVAWSVFRERKQGMSADEQKEEFLDIVTDTFMNAPLESAPSTVASPAEEYTRGRCDGFEAGLLKAAQMLDDTAAKCQPGSPAEEQNWPFVLKTNATKLRNMAKPNATASTADWACPAGGNCLSPGRCNDVCAKRSHERASLRSAVPDVLTWQAFLEWNRAQPTPLVEVGSEYAVAQVVMRLYREQSAPSSTAAQEGHVLVPLEPPASIPRQGYDDVLFQHCRDDDYEGLYREMVKRAAVPNKPGVKPDNAQDIGQPADVERLSERAQSELRGFSHMKSGNWTLSVEVIRELLCTRSSTALKFEPHCPDGSKCAQTTTGCQVGQCSREHHGRLALPPEANELAGAMRDARRYAARRKMVYEARMRYQISGPRQSFEEFCKEYDAECDKEAGTPPLRSVPSASGEYRG